MATTPVFLPGDSSWTEEPGGLQSMDGRVRHSRVTVTLSHSQFKSIHVFANGKISFFFKAE